MERKRVETLVSEKVEERVERTISEQLERRLTMDSRYTQRLIDRIHTDLYNRVVVERERLGGFGP